MKLQLVIILLGMTLVPCSGFAAIDPDDKRDQETNPLEDWELLKKPLEKQRQEQLADKTHEVLDVFEAIGGVAAQLIGAGPRVDPEPFEQQLAPQFDQLLKAELRFVHTICQPTRNSTRPSRRLAMPASRWRLKKCARVQAQMQEGGFRLGQLVKCPTPARSLRGVGEVGHADIVGGTNETLSTRTRETSRCAETSRAAQSGRPLDQELVLTAEQRYPTHRDTEYELEGQLGTSIGTCSCTTGNFFRLLPGECVLPLLNETQKEIWKGMPKRYVGDWMEFGFLCKAISWMTLTYRKRWKTPIRKRQGRDRKQGRHEQGSERTANRDPFVRREPS